MVVDNASWHKKKTSKWQAFQPMLLSLYLPDINPIERIWLTIKARWFNNYVCSNGDQLFYRLDQAIFDVVNNPSQDQKTVAIETLI